VADAARAGFLDGMHTGFIVGAIAAAVGIVVTLLFLPSHARSTDVAIQADEYRAEHAEGVDAPVDHAPVSDLSR
jgi:hypothetical protein